MRSKGWKLIGLLLVLSLIAAACASDSADDTEAPDATEAPSGGDDAPADTEAPDAGLEGTITVLVHQNPPMVEYMEEFNAMFTEATGVEVDMSVVGAGDLSTVTQTRLTANDIDVIDIFGFANPVQDYMTGACLLIDGGISLPWWANRGSAAPA